jgi:hypothetical protein
MRFEKDQLPESTKLFGMSGGHFGLQPAGGIVASETRVPLLELSAQRSIERSRPGLEQEMCPFLRPLHLLAL